MTRDPRTVLITGATDGIGLALARHYADQGVRLILVGRRPISSLDGELFVPEMYCQADLSKPDCAFLMEAFLQEQGIDKIDVLIQNAGTGYYGSVASQASSHIRDLVAVNLMGPVRLTRACYSFVRKAAGKVVLIGSVVSTLPCPDYAVYAATKAALESFGRNLQTEGGVRVQVILPGATRTGLHEKIGLTREVIDWESFPSAEQVARQIAKAIEGSQRVRILGMGNRFYRILGLWFGGLLEGVMKRSASV